MKEGEIFAPPVDPEKKDQASSQGTSDSTFFSLLLKKLNEDKLKMEEIAKLKSGQERRKVIHEYINFVMEDSDEYILPENFSENEMRESLNLRNKLILERLSALKFNDNEDELGTVEFDRSWSYEQVKDLIRRLIFSDDGKTRFGKNKTQAVEIISIMNIDIDGYEYKDTKTVSDHAARYLSELLSSYKKSIPDKVQKNIVLFSECLYYANFDETADFLINLFENKNRIKNETLNEIVSRISEYSFTNKLQEMVEERISKNDIDPLKLIKIIEALKYASILLEPEISGNKIKNYTHNLCTELLKRKNNYLLIRKIQTAQGYIVGERDKDNFDSENDAILRRDYSNKPIMAEDQHDKAGFTRDSCYEKLSKDYAVIYDPMGQINCFFKLKRVKEGEETERKEGRIVSLKKILEKEGIPKDFLEKHSAEEITWIYKSLLELPLRREIENDFGIKLEDFSVREQLQFVMFLSSKTEEEVKRIKTFTYAGHSEEGKKNRIRSFLALESDPDLGERIVDLGLDLSIDEGARNRIFSAYAELVSQSEKIADEILEICGEIFPEQIMDRNAIQAAILKRSNKIFSEASQAFLMANVDMAINRESWMDNEELGSNNAERLVNAAFRKQRKNLDDLVNELKRQEMINQKTIESLKKMAEMVNAMIEPLALARGGVVYGETFTEIEPHLNPEQIKEYKKATRYDSKRIKKTIAEMEERIRNFDDKELDNLTRVGLDGRRIKFKGKKKEELREAWKKLMLPEEETIENLKKLLPYVTSLEATVKKIINAQDSDNPFNEKTSDVPLESKGSQVSDKIFEKFDEIIAQARKSKQEIKALFNEDTEITDEEMDKLMDNLVKKANDILETHVRRISSGEDPDEQEALEEINHIETDMELNAQILKVLRKGSGRPVRPDDFKGVSFEKRTAREFFKPETVSQVAKAWFEGKRSHEVPGSAFEGAFVDFEEDKQRQSADILFQMFEIYAANYKDKPELREMLLQSFSDNLRDRGNETILYVYLKKNKVIAFDRFDRQESGKRYFGSFNVSPELKNSAIGGAMMEVSLHQEAEESDLEAECLADVQISSYYIEKEGFMVDEFIPNYKGTPENVFHIIRRLGSAQDNKKTPIQEDIIRECIESLGQTISNDAPRQIFRFKANSEEFVAKCNELINSKGYQMTRYFFAGKKKEEVYCVFEKGS
jgi:hypothetical protein